MQLQWLTKKISNKKIRKLQYYDLEKHLWLDVPSGHIISLNPDTNTICWFDDGSNKKRLAISVRGSEGWEWISVPVLSNGFKNLGISIFSVGWFLKTKTSKFRILKQFDYENKKWETVPSIEMNKPLFSGIDFSQYSRISGSYAIATGSYGISYEDSQTFYREERVAMLNYPRLYICLDRCLEGSELVVVGGNVMSARNHPYPSTTIYIAAEFLEEGSTVVVDEDTKRIRNL